MKLDEYKNLEPWQLDLDEEGDQRFTSEEEYDEYLIALTDDLVREAKRGYKAVRREWARAAARFERSLDKLSTLGGASNDPAWSDLPFLYKAILELVAILFDSLPRPQYLSRQSTEDEFVGAINYWSAWELDVAEFDMLMFDVGLDVNLFNLGVLKQTIDGEQSGPFDQDGRIIFKRIEPRAMLFDPYAQSTKWDDNRYIIEVHAEDLATIRKMFPIDGFRVNPDPRYSLPRGDKDSVEEEDDGGGVMDSPANRLGGPFSTGERGRALIRELWLHDESLEFCTEDEWVPELDSDEKPKYDDHGYPMGEYKPKEDINGDVIGYYRRRYPNGRLIVTAGDVVLLDIPNPYRHKLPPYTFFRGRPTKKALSVGDASFLLIVEKKMNEIYGRVMRNAMCNIATPLLVDSGAFDAPKKYRNITDDPDLVIQLRPNAQIRHLAAGEIPNFIYPFATFLKSFFDDLMGVQGVMRGQLEQGSQLSAEAMGQLQDQASSRVRMKSRLIESGLKNFGYQLMWNIRQTYPSQKSFVIMDPSTGKPSPLNWNDDEAQDDYACVIQAGSSLPGAKMGAYKQAMELYREGIVDDEFVLDAGQVPGKQNILQRTQQKRDKRLKIAIEAKEMGVDAKERQNFNGQPGRRVKD